MIIYTTDDCSSHNTILQGMVKRWCTQHQISPITIIECQNGQEALLKWEEQVPDLITLDINMPILDGLSTLVKIRRKNKTTPIVMVSSENESNISRHSTTNAQSQNLNDDQKLTLLNRVVTRVVDDEIEPNKINSVLEAVSALKLNPIDTAMTLGANGYVQKPYLYKNLENVLSKLNLCLEVSI